MSATLSLVKILFTYFVTTFSLSYYQEGGGHNGSQVVARDTGPPTHLLGVGRGNLTGDYSQRSCHADALSDDLLATPNKVF